MALQDGGKPAAAKPIKFRKKKRRKRGGRGTIKSSNINIDARDSSVGEGHNNSLSDSNLSGAVDEPGMKRRKVNHGAGEEDEAEVAADVRALQRNRSRRRGKGVNTKRLMKSRKNVWGCEAEALKSAVNKSASEVASAPKTGLQTSDAFGTTSDRTHGSNTEVRSGQAEKLDKLMEQYINDELVKRGVTVPNSAIAKKVEETRKSREGDRELYGLESGAGTAKSSNDDGQDGLAGGPLAWNTGIAEVALPAETKWRNIERTERAARKQQRRYVPHSRSGGGVGTHGRDANVQHHLRSIVRRDRSMGSGGVGNVATNFGAHGKERAKEYTRKMGGRSRDNRSSGTGGKRLHDANDDAVARRFRKYETQRRNR